MGFGDHSTISSIHHRDLVQAEQKSVKDSMIRRIATGLRPTQLHKQAHGNTFARSQGFGDAVEALQREPRLPQKAESRVLVALHRQGHGLARAANRVVGRLLAHSETNKRRTPEQQDTPSIHKLMPEDPCAERAPKSMQEHMSSASTSNTAAKATMAVAECFRAIARWGSGSRWGRGYRAISSTKVDTSSY